MKTADIEVKLIDSCGTDLNVCNAARVSFHKESDFEVYYESKDELDHFDFGDTTVVKYRLSEKDTKLIAYLAKHKHTSPFNHAFMSFRVKAPIFVARQLVKHSYLPWNEVSRRYVTEEPEFYMPTHWRKAAENVKQGSSDEFVDITQYYGDQGKHGSSDPFDDSVAIALEAYQHMLNRGVCPEMARMVLPQNTMTEWIWSGTLFAFARMCKLRLDSHTQRETQKVAQLIDKEAAQLFPVSWKALLEYAE